jgi:hypothetical protein
MSRPVGVTASAIVAILGSILALVFAGMGIASLFIETTRPQPPNSAQLVIAGTMIIVAFAGIGIWTSVGLFRLRSWARTSILVFAGFLAAGSVFSLLITMAIPKSPTYSADTEHVVRLAMAAMFGIPLAIAVWWLIQFNSQSTKAAFACPIVEPASPRPLSISIIGWTCIAGGATCLFPLLMRSPAFWFGVTFTGWSAGLLYAVFGALQLYIGKGLLDLRERARILAIAWFGLSFVQLAVVTLVPSLRQRMLEFPGTMEPSQPNPIPVESLITMMYVVFAFGGIVAAAAIWFLIRERAAFVRAETS